MVVLELYYGDYRTLTESELAWIVNSAVDTGQPVEGSASYSLKLNHNFWQLLKNYQSNEIAPESFFWLKQLAEEYRLHLEGRDAFAFVTMLYASTCRLVSPHGQWAYDQYNVYDVSFNRETRKLYITFPLPLLPILIGRNGSHVEAVAAALQPVVDKVIIVR